jgi:hypothetical protein
MWADQAARAARATPGASTKGAGRTRNDARLVRRQPNPASAYPTQIGVVTRQSLIAELFDLVGWYARAPQSLDHIVNDTEVIARYIQRQANFWMFDWHREGNLS